MATSVLAADWPRALCLAVAAATDMAAGLQSLRAPASGRLFFPAIA